MSLKLTKNKPPPQHQQQPPPIPHHARTHHMETTCIITGTAHRSHALGPSGSSQRSRSGGHHDVRNHQSGAAASSSFPFQSPLRSLLRMENDECSPGARGDLSLEDILLQSDNHDEREVEDEQGCDGSASCARTAAQAAAAAQAFTANLRNRFVNKQIYTCIESTVIAMNPYENLTQLYSSEMIAAYEHHNICALPPHIFALCEYVLYCLREHGRDQCIIASGVSGSGKTESIKVALHYFIFGSSQRVELNQIKSRLNTVPLILEAFGNAYTESNYNSTRLYYMLEVDFDWRGDPLGGQISDYFLEKTRVAKHEIYGHNYHIFYQLICGASSNLLKFLKLKRNIDYYQLVKGKRSEYSLIQGVVNQSEEFSKTKSYLQMVGFTSAEIIECFQILAFILKLGNVSFLRKANIDSTEGCTILNDYEILDICDAYNLDVALFQKLLTQRVVKNQDDIFIAELCANTASKIRASLCKALYFRLVTWIIRHVNELIKTGASSTLTRNNLSLFDSLGFEHYNINFYEQLLCNYLYEKVQQLFVDIHFVQKQEEYIREDIEWKPLELPSNDAICDLIEKPQTGILATLNTESNKVIYFREEIFIQNLNKNCAANVHYTEIANPVFVDSEGNGYLLQCLPFRRLSAGDVSKSIPQLCFAIKHYNANVVYSINHFIEKNNDHISRDWSYLFYKSDHILLRTMFPEGNPVRKNPKKPISLANQFTISVESIIAKLTSKNIHFIKCIQPNKLKQANMFDDDYVHRQVCSHFLIEHARLLKQGYFYQEVYATFFKRFRVLCTKTWPVWRDSNLNGVYTLLFDVFKGDLSNFNFGKTKVFVKRMKTLMELEECRSVKQNEVAIRLQRQLRMWMARRRFLRMIKCQIMIARYWRNWKRQQYLLWLSRHLPSMSPLCRDWPSAPRLMKGTSFLLRALFHKWRCHRYRLCFDQTNRNRMREKVTAMSLFKGRKQSYKNSISHPFRGDYIRLRQNVKWKKISASLGEIYVVFADLVSKVTKRCGKFVQKLIVVSTTSFLILDHRTMQINHQIKLSDVYKICTSPFMDNILIINIYTYQQTAPLQTSRAFIFESSHLIELITKLYLVIQNVAGRGPLIEVSHDFQLHTGKETLVLVFKNRKKDQQAESSSTPATITAPSSSATSNEVKISRKSNRLEITV